MAAKKIKYDLKNSLTNKREIKRSRKCVCHKNAKLNGREI